MNSAPDHQLHIPVNPTPRIPAAVGNQTVTGNHLHPVLFPKDQPGIQFHIKSRIPIQTRGCQSPVDIDHSRLIDSLKLQKHFLLFPFLRCRKRLLVNIFPARIKPGLCAALYIRSTLLMNHPIMGKMYRPGLIGPHKSRRCRITSPFHYLPVPIKILSDHAASPFRCFASHSLFAFSTFIR